MSRRECLNLYLDHIDETLGQLRAGLRERVRLALDESPRLARAKLDALLDDFDDKAETLRVVARAAAKDGR